MLDFEKIVRPGTIETWPGQQSGMYARVKYADGRLSISGAVGPMSNGDAAGSSGQWIMSFREYDRRGHATLDQITPAPGWTAASIKRFLDIWDNWHLNDMRAECEHQTALGWREMAAQEITLYRWRLSPLVERLNRKAQKRLESASLAGESVAYTPEELRLLRLAPMVTTGADVAPGPEYIPNGPRYNGDTFNRPSETKTRGWVCESEHPDGLLSKPCPECGYPRGSAWRREAVPDDVLDFLRSCPATDTQPAWC